MFCKLSRRLSACLSPLTLVTLAPLEDRLEHVALNLEVDPHRQLLARHRSDHVRERL